MPFYLMTFIVSFVMAFMSFYAILAIYERYVKKIEITNQERYTYVALAALVWPASIVGGLLFVFVKIVNLLKKL